MNRCGELIGRPVREGQAVRRWRQKQRQQPLHKQKIYRRDAEIAGKVTGSTTENTEMGLRAQRKAKAKAKAKVKAKAKAKAKADPFPARHPGRKQRAHHPGKARMGSG